MQLLIVDEYSKLIEPKKCRMSNVERRMSNALLINGSLFRFSSTKIKYWRGSELYGSELL